MLSYIQAIIFGLLQGATESPQNTKKEQEKH